RYWSSWHPPDRVSRHCDAASLVAMTGLDLYNLSRAEPGDRFVVIAVFPQHFLGMFALFRGRMGDMTGRAAEFYRLVDDRGVAERSMMHRRGHAEMLHLRVGEHFVHAIDRAAGHAGLVQLRDQIA